MASKGAVLCEFNNAETKILPHDLKEPLMIPEYTNSNRDDDIFPLNDFMDKI